MLNAVERKNRKKVEEGKIELLLADVLCLPLDDSSIDKAYTVNTVYFWQDIHQGFSEIKRVLKPGGLFLNVIYVKEWLDKLPMTQYGFSKYKVEEIEKITGESGLKIENIFVIQENKSVCVVAKKHEKNDVNKKEAENGNEL
jgi:ubiquinone/menaquinone biosynthesis C-methylase UbiE